MLSVFLIWIYMFLTLLPIGFAALTFLYQRFHYTQSDSHTILLSHALLSGLVVVTLYSEFYSLFDGLGGKANVLLILISLLCIIRYRKELCSLLSGNLNWLNNLSFFKTLLLIFIVLLLLYFTSSGFFVYDTALYHAQAIHWLETYGIAPGISNIQYRLGYNSSSFCFFALYSMRWLQSQSFHACNGFVLLFTIFIAAKNLFRGFHKSHLMSNLCSMGSLICCSILIYNAVSPTSDIMPMAMVLWLVMEWTTLIEKKEGHVCPYALLCVCGVFTFTGKVSMAMIVLLVIKPATILIKEKRIKEIFMYSGLGILVLLPFLIRNVIISGWLLYPFSAIDLFNFDWKILKSDVIIDAQNSLFGSRGSSIPALYVHKWLPIWWQKSTIVEKYWVITLGLSILLWLKHLLSLIHNRRTCDFTWLHLEITFLAGVLYWFFSAPVLRYSSSFIVLYPFIVIGTILLSDTSVISKHSKIIQTASISILSIFIILGTIPDWNAFSYTEDYRLQNLKLLRQVDYDTTPVVSVNTGSTTIYYPISGDQAWYYAFPASDNEQRAHSVVMRGEKIRDGFQRNY